VNRISPNQWQWIALMHYLTEEIDLFKPQHINRATLKRLLSQKIFFLLKVESNKTPPTYLIKKDVPCDFFILILEGKIHSHPQHFDCALLTMASLNSDGITFSRQSASGNWSRKAEI
jgi:hypothetical protein